MTENSNQKQADLHLILKIGKGDQQSLVTLYDKYAPALAGISKRIVQSDVVADEVLQKVFQQVWSEASIFDASKHSLFTWLIKLTRQIAFSSISSSAAAFSVPPIADEISNPSEHFERHLFDLLYYRGINYTEIAVKMNIPADKIKKHLRQAIKNLEQTV